MRCLQMLASGHDGILKSRTSESTCTRFCGLSSTATSGQQRRKKQPRHGTFGWLLCTQGPASWATSTTGITRRVPRRRDEVEMPYLHTNHVLQVNLAEQLDVLRAARRWPRRSSRSLDLLKLEFVRWSFVVHWNDLVGNNIHGFEATYLVLRTRRGRSAVNSRGSTAKKANKCRFHGLHFTKHQLLQQCCLSSCCVSRNWISSRCGFCMRAMRNHPK